MSDKDEADTDLATILAQFTNYIMNERVRAYNEGVDAERERCAQIAEGLNGWGSPPAPKLAQHIARTILDANDPIRRRF